MYTAEVKYILEIYKEHILVLDMEYLYGDVIHYARTMVLTY